MQEHGDWDYLKEWPEEDIAAMLQLEMNINFPNCLEVRNGKPRTRSGNFRNHASYSKPDKQLECPDDFPFRIPTLNLEVRYDLKAMRKILPDEVVNNVDNWILSSGDSSGAGAHADFVSGWPEEMFQEMLDKCDDGKDMNDTVTCPITKYMDGPRKEMNEKTVPFNNPVPDEAVSPVASLPGSSGECSFA